MTSKSMTPSIFFLSLQRYVSVMDVSSVKANVPPLAKPTPELEICAIGLAPIVKDVLVDGATVAGGLGGR